MSDRGAVLLALLLLAGNAFFVAAEFSMISARRSQIEPRAEAGSRLARLALKSMENIALVIGVNQLGITVCSLVLGAVGEPAIAHLIEPGLAALSTPETLVRPIAFAVSLSIVVYLHVVMGEMIPKNIAIAGPDRTAMMLAPVIWGFVTVLRPVIVAINLVAAGILRLFGVRLRDEVSSTFTREQVAELVEESRGEGLLEENEYDRLAGALGFTEKTVEVVLMPRDSLTTVLRGASAEDIESVCSATGFSRFPVADEAGTLVGYLHIKDALEPDVARRSRPVDREGIRPLAAVRPDDALHIALQKLQRGGAHMAQVLDRGGTCLGAITLEDVIEELVGEIRDAAHLEEMG